MLLLLLLLLLVQVFFFPTSILAFWGGRTLLIVVVTTRVRFRGTKGACILVGLQQYQVYVRKPLPILSSAFRSHSRKKLSPYNYPNGSLYSAG